MGVRIGVVDEKAPGGVRWLKNVAFAQDIIHFGTDPALSCYRIHPRADREGVRRRHCTLFFSGGMYRLDFDRGAAVFIDGAATPAPHMCNPFHAKRRIELRLGQPAYRPESRVPTFVVERMDPDAFDVTTLSGQEKKDWQGEQKRIRNAIDRTDENRQSISRMSIASGLGITALVIAFVIAVAGFFGAFRGVAKRVEIIEASGQITKIADEQVAPSVAVLGVTVGDRFTPVGTGWLCCANLPGGGNAIESPFIVTNIHVTDQIADRMGLAEAQAQPGGAMVSAAGSTEKAEAFQAIFPAQKGDTAPLKINIPAAAWTKGVATNALSQLFRSMIGADGIKAADLYDVAVIKLSPENHMALRYVQPLQLAQDSATLHVGVSSAIVGFPFEQLALSFNAKAPVAKAFPTPVIRLTDAFAGVRSTRPAPAPGRPNRTPAALIALQAESAGGISGSPVVAFEGDPAKPQLRVIGMVMNASFLNGTAAGAAAFVRIPNSNTVFALDKTSIEDLAIGANLSDPTLQAEELQRWLDEKSDSSAPPLVAAFNTFERDAQSDQCTVQFPEAPKPAEAPAPTTSADSATQLKLAASAKPISVLRLDQAVAADDSAEGQGTLNLSQKAGERVLVAVKSESPVLGELRLAFKSGDQLDKGDHAVDVVSSVRQARPTEQSFDVIVQGPRNASVAIYTARASCK